MPSHAWAVRLMKGKSNPLESVKTATKEINVNHAVKGFLVLAKMNVISAPTLRQIL